MPSWHSTAFGHSIQAGTTWNRKVRNIGIPVCCNLPVVKDSHDGQEKFYCLECHRTIALIGRQWVVSNWGSKGLKFIFLEGDNALLKSFQDIQRNYPLP